MVIAHVPFTFAWADAGAASTAAATRAPAHISDLPHAIHLTGWFSNVLKPPTSGEYTGLQEMAREGGYGGVTVSDAPPRRARESRP